jgi:hypothetical protein
MRTALVLLAGTMLSACGPEAQPPDTTVSGVVLAGPVCPVVTDPPDPACEDRPVADAEIVVRDESGDSVATVRSAEDGSFSIALAEGRYELLPQPVEGLMGTAATVIVTVEDGVPVEPIAISYDTGIR